MCGRQDKYNARRDTENLVLIGNLGLSTAADMYKFMIAKMGWPREFIGRVLRHKAAADPNNDVLTAAEREYVVATCNAVGMSDAAPEDKSRTTTGGNGMRKGRCGKCGCEIPEDMMKKFMQACIGPICPECWSKGVFRYCKKNVILAKLMSAKPKRAQYLIDQADDSCKAESKPDAGEVENIIKALTNGVLEKPYCRRVHEHMIVFVADEQEMCRIALIDEYDEEIAQAICDAGLLLKKQREIIDRQAKQLEDKDADYATLERMYKGVRTELADLKEETGHG